MSTKTKARAVLLAAGQGKRMKSAKPKVLHEVLGRSILSRVLTAVDALDVEHVHVIIGHGSDQVRDFLELNRPKTPYSVHLQEPQLGTGHALQQLLPALEGFSGTLLVTVADTPLLTGETLGSLLNTHREQGAAVTLLSAVVDDAKSYGRVYRDDEGNVAGIVEDKDASPEQKLLREINTAIYCFAWPEIRDGLTSLTNNNNQNEYYLTDVLSWAYQGGLKTAAVVADDWREVAGINSRLELAEANRLMRDINVKRLALESGVTIVDPATTWVGPEVSIGQDTTIMPGCILFGDITIGANCFIGPNTVTHGPVVIGDGTSVINSYVANSQIGSHCKVGPFAHLRDGNVVGDGVRLGNFVEIKNSTIANKTNVSHLSYVGDADLGSGSNLGAGTIIANYDHLTKKKSRTTIGDNVATGSNSVLIAPIVIGDGAVVAASTAATKDVPAGALAVGRAKQVNLDNWADNKRKQKSTSLT
ncbi:MAG: bifunctional UDP-N-acetylglucosamine diphosphorylase/glucosamine-1-phosphate N-acetyltransferase GlmU [Candidatus Obscuribacterales bacterium]|nr:bifunctional UDP-N-acetylglucosamine diphosphorylase/glucosamine-1-phosphate N-acetyltransferase GlmU [Candidatus Obscuribacterales bacterium]